MHVRTFHSVLQCLFFPGLWLLWCLPDHNKILFFLVVKLSPSLVEALKWETGLYDLILLQWYEFKHKTVLNIRILTLNSIFLNDYWLAWTSKCLATLEKLQELRFKNGNSLSISRGHLRQDQLEFLVLLLLCLLSYGHRNTTARAILWGLLAARVTHNPPTLTSTTHGIFYQQWWDTITISLLAMYFPIFLLTRLMEARR